MKRSTAIMGGLILVIGLWALLTTLNRKNTGQSSDTDPDSTRQSESKAGAPLPIELAEQKESQGEFATALELYCQVKKARPDWPPVCYKIATCQAALGKTADSANTLRELVK